MGPKDKTDGTTQECVFCYSSEENEEAYGKMLRKSGISIHYFCMLFSSDLWQRGKRDCDGILGFMPSDIRREQRRGIRLFCLYCKKKGASIRCSVKNCGKQFHFRCGREAGGLCQFYEQFRAFCPDHRPHQKPSVLPKVDESRSSSMCCICMQAVSPQVSSDTLCSPCCGGSWFHRICIQRYAVTAGAYFLKCPLCNNKQQFESEMLKFGIYIPEQDAAWELEPNAYQELLERYHNCDADECLCPEGRGHVGEAGSEWELVLCTLCGSSGTHVKCKGFVDNGRKSMCPECAQITQKIKKKRQKVRQKSPEKWGPQVAGSVEELRQQLEDQRLSLVKARCAAQRRNTRSSCEEEAPSTSKQPSMELSESESDYEEPTSIASPSVLDDHRLFGSTPVVQLERAEYEVEVNQSDSEVEVNQLDSEVEVNIVDSEEDRSLECESNDSSGPGCARLISFLRLNLARQPGRHVSAPGPWGVRKVIENGQKKVLLLSMTNTESSRHKESSVASATTTLQRQLTPESSSTVGVSKEMPCSSENVGLVQQRQKTNQDQKSEPQKRIPVFGNHGEDSGKPGKDSEKQCQDSENQNRFFITSDRRAAFRQMVPALNLKPKRQCEIFQVSDSSSDGEAGDRSESTNTFTQPAESTAMEKITSKDKEYVRDPDVPRKTAENVTKYVRLIRTLAQDSASVFQTSVDRDPCPVMSNSEMTSASATKEVNSGSLQEGVCELNPEKAGSQSSTGQQTGSRGSCPTVRKVNNHQQGLHPTSEKDLSLTRTATQLQQTGRKSNTFKMSEMSHAGIPRTSKQKNIAHNARFALKKRRRKRKKGYNKTTQSASLAPADDVIAMRQSFTPCYSQFQIPKPATVGLSAASSRPVFPLPTGPTTATAKLSAQCVAGRGPPPLHPERLQGVRPQMRGYLASDHRFKAPSGPDSDRNRSFSVWQRVRQPVPAFQSQPVRIVPSAGLNPEVGGTPSAVPAQATPSLPGTSVQNGGHQLAVVSSSMTAVTTPSLAKGAGGGQPYYITVPSTQSFQFGVVTMQPQNPSLPQNSVVGMPAASPFNVTVIGSQPQPPNPANAAARFFPLVTQNSVPFVQWIPLPQCFPNTAGQSSSYSQIQGQHHRPTATLSAFHSLPSEWQRAVHASQRSSDSAASVQHNGLVSQPVSSPERTVTSDDAAAGRSDHQLSLSDLPSSTLTNSFSNYRENGVMSKSQPSRSLGLVTQLSDQSLHSASSGQPCVSEQTFQHLLSQRRNDPVPQSSEESEEAVSPAGTGESDMGEEGCTGRTDDGIPVTSQSPSSPTPVMTFSRTSASVTETVSGGEPSTSAVVSTPQKNMLQAAGLYCSPMKRTDSVAATSQARSRLPAAERNTTHSRPTSSAMSSRVARVPPNMSALCSARSRSSSPEAPTSATTSSSKDESCALLNKPHRAASPEAAAESDAKIRKNGAAAKVNQPVVPQAVCEKDQQLRAGTDTAAFPPVVSSLDGDSSLAISRGKIWLNSETQKNDVVLLSDSDDGSDKDDLEITGISSRKTVGKGPKVKRFRCSGAHHVNKGSAAVNHSSSESPQITGLLVPAPHKPPCPIHGHFRLVQHPRPTVPAKRNADGSLSIDLTSEEPEPKQARIERWSVSDNDSDVEIIG